MGATKATPKIAAIAVGVTSGVCVTAAVVTVVLVTTLNGE